MRSGSSKGAATAQADRIRHLFNKLTPQNFGLRFYTVLAALLYCAQLALDCHAETPTLRYEVIARYPHLNGAFTQGFELRNDTVYASSGLYRRSYVASFKLGEREPIRKQALPAALFGEGLTVWNDRIYVVTWREQRGLILEKDSLNEIGKFTYAGEGWGLAHNDNVLIMSDGTSVLRLIDPQTWQTQRTLSVRDGDLPVDRLNELEWIPAQDSQPSRLLANVWQSDDIVVIDIDTGAVTARIDLHRLYPKSTRAPDADVMNGIAFRASQRTLLVTGKFWPYIYELRLLDALP